MSAGLCSCWHHWFAQFLPALKLLASLIFLITIGDRVNFTALVFNKNCTKNLNDESDDPNADKEWIAVESLEDITFAVYLTSIDLVEQSHHHECVEDDGEVLCWPRSPKVRRVAVINSAAVDVK